MATLTHVRSGDVISKELFNDLLDMLADFETRLTAVELGGSTGGSGSIISSFNPLVQEEIGKELTMFGNFDFPPASNNVTLDGLPITSFRPGSNNLQLLFVVPTLSTIPPSTGKTVNIRVQNTKGTDQKSYKVLPASPSTVPAPTIAAVVDLVSSTPLLRTALKARITGTNFAAAPTDNTVRVKVTSGITTVTYPKPGDPPLVIDAAQTTTTQIVFTVPVVQEIGIGSTGPATVEVAVGSALPASIATTVLRMP
jgi:hypothetical protein